MWSKFSDTTLNYTLGWNGHSRVFKLLTSVYCHSSKTVQGGIRQNDVQRWSIFHIGLIAHCPHPPRWARHFYYIEQYWVKVSYDTRHQPTVQWSWVSLWYNWYIMRHIQNWNCTFRMLNFHKSTLTIFLKRKVYILRTKVWSLVFTHIICCGIDLDYRKSWKYDLLSQFCHCFNKSLVAYFMVE